MFKFFKNPETLEDLKAQYKTLAKKHHPDCGGRTEDMQEVNAEYDKLFNLLKNTHRNAKGEKYTSTTATTETADQFKNIIEQLINLDGIEIEIIGCWLWVSGDTRPHKEVLKALGFRWGKQKKAWYYHEGEYRKKGNKNWDMDDLRGFWGSEKVEKSTEFKPILEH